jgi:hypothetical protein
MSDITYTGSEHIFKNPYGTDVVIKPITGQNLNVNSQSSLNKVILAEENISVEFNGTKKLIVAGNGALKANVSIGANVIDNSTLETPGTALLISAAFPQSAFVCQGDYSDAGHKMVSFRNNIGEVGRIRVDPGSTAYLTSSDARKKSNITDYEFAVEDLMSIRIRNYTWNVLPNEPQVGIIAQELEEVFPEYVDKSDPDHLMIETNVFIPYLIKAVQELKAEIEELKLLI